MNKFLLIDEKYIKDNSIIELNVAPKILNIIIWDVQKNQLKKILSNKVYNEVIFEAENLTDNPAYLMPESYKELIFDYVQPFMLASTVVEFIISNNYKLTNKGVLKLSDVNASGVDSAEIEYFKNYYDNKLVEAKQSLIDYLKVEDDITPDSNCTSTGDASNDVIGWYLETPSYNGLTGKNKFL